MSNKTLMIILILSLLTLLSAIRDYDRVNTLLAQQEARYGLLMINK